jgi:hypothetical protein
MRIVEHIGLTVVCFLLASCSAASTAPTDDPSLGDPGTGGSAPGDTTVPPGSGGSTTVGMSGSGGMVVANMGGSGGSSAMDAGPATSKDAGVAAKDQGAPDAPTPPPPADPCVAKGTCPANTWVSVTPPGITIPPEGLRSVVRDPSRPSDIYMGGGAAGIWKSTDYGNTWTMINKGFGYIPQGLCIAVLPSQGATPAPIIIADSCGCGKSYKSIDGGATFRTVDSGLKSDFYSFDVDPHDGNHIISGFHEADGVAESTDAGETWHMVSGTGFPSGGISWYPTFIDTGVAATTAKTWIAIAQNGGSVVITHDGGASWTIPTGLQGTQHPHGNAQIFQRGGTIFVPGGGGTGGNGVFRSTDWGATFTKVTKDTPAAVAWGTANHVYSMYAWSCFGCPIDPNFMVASANGDTWTTPGVPKTMLMGADHVAVTSDGTHNIFVAAFRSSGIWRYVEQ